MARTSVIAALVLVLGLAACGGGDDDGSGDVETVTVTVAETAPEPAADEEGAGEEGGPLLVIMDGSGSMDKRLPGGEKRIDAAKAALSDLVASLPAEQQVGLRTFGGQARANCARTPRELVSPVAPPDEATLSSAIAGLRPGGATPIGESLREAATDLPDEPDGTIILVSDGKDNCAPPDPCDVAEDLKAQGIDVVIETVGFALGGDEGARRQLTCIAEATGGSFHDVEDAEELGETLSEVATREERTLAVKGEQVECGPHPSQAPTLEPGTYRDTILPSETLYCGFDVSGVDGVSVQVVTFAGTQDSCGAAGFAVVDENTHSLGSLEDRATSSQNYPLGDCDSDAPITVGDKADTADLDTAYLLLESGERAGCATRCEGEYPIQLKVEEVK